MGKTSRLLEQLDVAFKQHGVNDERTNNFWEHVNHLLRFNVEYRQLDSREVDQIIGTLVYGGPAEAALAIEVLVVGDVLNKMSPLVKQLLITQDTNHIEQQYAQLKARVANIQRGNPENKTSSLLQDTTTLLTEMIDALSDAAHSNEDGAILKELFAIATIFGVNY